MNTVVQRSFLDLKELAAYASCSVRWLRDRLTDQFRPLPHYRVNGKLLVKRDEFDTWMEAYRVGNTSASLDQIVECVVADVARPLSRGLTN